MSHVRPVQTLLEYLSGGTGKTTSLVRKMTVNGRSWTVSYDGNGNITSLADRVEAMEPVVDSGLPQAS